MKETAESLGFVCGISLSGHRYPADKTSQNEDYPVVDPLYKSKNIYNTNLLFFVDFLLYLFKIFTKMFVFNFFFRNVIYIVDFVFQYWDQALVLMKRSM